MNRNGLSPKQYRKLRGGIETNSQAHLSHALVFLKRQLGWTASGNCRIVLQRLESTEFAKYHPADRLAGEIEGKTITSEGDVTRIHYIRFNWPKMVDIDHRGFVLQYIRCLIHELLEVYDKHTGNRLVHQGPNEDQPTDIELCLTYLFLKQVLGIPKEDFSGYEWK